MSLIKKIIGLLICGFWFFAFEYDSYDVFLEYYIKDYIELFGATIVAKKQILILRICWALLLSGLVYYFSRKKNGLYTSIYTWIVGILPGIIIAISLGLVTADFLVLRLPTSILEVVGAWFIASHIPE